MRKHKCQCGNHIAVARYNLGYRNCMPCGDKRAKQQRKGWLVAPAFNKGAYQLITDPDDMRGTNPKRTT